MSSKTTLRSILVLGMHRSGTSAIAGMLGDVGCRLPSDLMDATPMNPKGFSESTSISMLNDELMQALGSSWFDWRPLHADPASSRIGAFLPRAFEATTGAFGDADLAVLKDPRISRLVPVWDQVLRDTGREVSYVHVHRDPGEVVASLNTWAGYDPAYGELLWLRYTLDAEAATRDHPRCFVSYANVLADWASQVQRISRVLNIAWPVPPRQGSATFVDTTLQRSTPAPKDSLSPWTREAVAVFEAWAAQGEDGTHRDVLDRLRAQLDGASTGLAGVIDGGRAADLRANRLAKTLNDRDGDEVGQGPARADLEHQLRVVRRDLRDAREDHGRAEEELAELAAAVEQARAEAADLASGRELVEQELSEIRWEHRRALEELAAARARLDELSEGLTENLAQRDQSDQALRESRREVERLVAELKAAIQQRDQSRRRASSQMSEAIAKALGSPRQGSEPIPRGGSSPRGDQRRLRERVEELERAQAAMLTSRSWRITSPLRRMSSALHRNEENK